MLKHLKYKIKRFFASIMCSTSHREFWRVDRTEINRRCLNYVVSDIAGGAITEWRWEICTTRHHVCALCGCAHEKKERVVVREKLNDQ